MSLIQLDFLALYLLAVLDELNLFLAHDDRYHDLRLDLVPFFPQHAGGLENGPALHLVDLGERDRDAAAPVTEHRVHLAQLLAPCDDLGRPGAPVLGLHVADELLHALVGPRQELVERRIQEADGDRLPLHDLEEVVEVGPLHREEDLQRLAPLLFRVGDDHLPELHDPLLVEEHVLRAAEADPLRLEVLGNKGRRAPGLRSRGR